MSPMSSKLDLTAREEAEAAEAFAFRDREYEPQPDMGTWH